jgi:hypothetical protein
MREHVDLNLTEAVEAAAMAIAKDGGVVWDTTADPTKLGLRELALVPVKAAAPFIVQQVLNDIASRTYDIG